MRGKKGVFYTLGLTLFVLLLLGLATLFFKHAISTESRHIELAAAQKIYDLDTSTQQIFTEAFTQKNSIRVTSTTKSTTIQENLPLDFTSIDSLMGKLKNHVENDFTIIKISLETFLDKHELLFKPLNIIYEHQKTNRISISPNPNITGYNILLIFAGNITSCTSNIEQEGTLNFTFSAQSPGNSCVVTQSNIKEIKMDLMVVNNQHVVIDVDEDRELLFESNATVQSNITINFPPLQNQRGYFELPIDIEINDSASGFYKKGKVRFPLLS